jgi:signal transduction histidine kinase/HD-like signal output (HDOD) protein
VESYEWRVDRHSSFRLPALHFHRSFRNSARMTLDPANRLELILQQLDQLPTLPSVAVRILELTSNERTNAIEVVRLIESDPALTARILRIVHRADGGTRIDLASVDRAVVLLGFEAVRNAVLAVSVFEVMGPSSNEKSPAAGRRFNREEFWKHNVAVACCSELICEKLGREVEPSDGFLAGLLHDLGKLALDSALPKSYARVIEAVELVRGDIAEVERRIIGLDHLTVGKRVAERWSLPAFLRDVIWLHGQTPQAIPASVKRPKLVHVVTLADQIVRRQHIGYSGNFAGSDVAQHELLAAIGIDAKALDDVLANLIARIEPRATALGLGQSTSEDLYRQALTRANGELGRLTDQLTIKNKKLAVRSKFFEALSQFHGELRPDAPPQVVLQAIAHTACSVTALDRCGAFSLMAHNDQWQAQVLVAKRDGEVIESKLQVMPESAMPIDFDSAQAAVFQVNKPMEWIVEGVAPKLGGSRLFWIPLVSEGLTIGGVVIGGELGLDARFMQQQGELTALSGGWSLALRTCQIREESRLLSEQLANANRQLQSTQQELLNAKTMSSVGELAAGAAHEMNNPLTVISGRSQLLAVALKSSDDAKLSASASLIAEQAQRLSDIITDLMHFARPLPSQSEVCAVSAVLEESVQQAKTIANVLAPTDDSRIVVRVNPDVPGILADKQQVTQALAQIVANAIQADDAAGHPQAGITISAAFDRFGKQVVVTIEDAGAGMDDATLKRAFDPFYSSQPAGRRRGMGLAKALRWVKANNGSIRLESQIDKGTSAVIVLQADPKSLATDAKPQASSKKLA